jgi:hypothetical protein
MTAGSGPAQFFKKTRDWQIGLAASIEGWLTTAGAICIGLAVFGLPVFLTVADHASVLNVLLSGP